MLKKILCTMTLFNSYVFGLEQTLYNNSHINTAQHTRGISFNGVREINNGFYLGEMRSNGKLLSIVMERLDYDNIQDWKKYISVQTNELLVKSVSSMVGAPNGSTSEGSKHCAKVLDEIPLDKNEVWVAYITRDHSPKRIELDCYVKDYCQTKSNAFAKNIEMFMTVTSAPGALITSHMGIACTIEALLSQRTKGISLDLHSFAAKVMLMRNPERRYMVNAPVWAMEKIILEALPKATFIGTREMRQKIQDVQGIEYREFLDIHGERIKSDLIMSYNEEADSKNRRYEGNQKALQDISDTSDIFIMGPGGKLILSEQKLESNVLQDELSLRFSYFKNPYRFQGLKHRIVQSKEFLELMKEYPPILSVINEDRDRDRVFTIFDDENPDIPFLTINESNKNDHDWIFRHPFSPSYLTHYIVVDLLALANAKQLVDENS